MESHIVAFQLQTWIKDAQSIFKTTDVLILFTKAFLPLLNNYEAATEEAETADEEELKEDAAFINAIMNTPLFKEAHRLYNLIRVYYF